MSILGTSATANIGTQGSLHQYDNWNIDDHWHKESMLVKVAVRLTLAAHSCPESFSFLRERMEAYMIIYSQLAISQRVKPYTDCRAFHTTMTLPGEAKRDLN